MLLRITNGTTTITLNTDSGSPTLGLYGAIYFPTAGDGATVTETIDVVFSGVSDFILSAMSTVQRLLTEASETTVYLEYALVNGFTVYRSPIISGDVVWSDDRLKRQFWDTNTVGECAIVYTRRDYWEGAEVTLADAINIDNGTASPYNAVTLASLDGNLPTPVKVRLQSNNVSNLVAPTVYVNLDAYAGLTTNQHLITSGSGAASWGTNLAYTTPLWNIAPTAAVVAKLAGKDVTVLAAFSVLPSTMYLRAGLSSLYDSVPKRLQTGAEQATGGNKLVSLGTLQIPKSANSGLQITISGFSALAGTATLLFVQLMPARGATRLDVTHEWKQGEEVIFDEENAFYDTGTAQYSNVRRSGGTLLAWPGRTNRLSVLFGESAAFTATRQTNVTVFARPRRSTV